MSFRTLAPPRQTAPSRHSAAPRTLGSPQTPGPPHTLGRISRPKWLLLTTADGYKSAQKQSAFLRHSAPLRPTFRQIILHFTRNIKTSVNRASTNIKTTWIPCPICPNALLFAALFGTISDARSGDAAIPSVNESAAKGARTCTNVLLAVIPAASGRRSYTNHPCRHKRRRRCRCRRKRKRKRRCICRHKRRRRTARSRVAAPESNPKQCGQSSGVSATVLNPTPLSLLARTGVSWLVRGASPLPRTRICQPQNYGHTKSKMKGEEIPWTS